jgi:hypothetical protein
MGNPWTDLVKEKFHSGKKMNKMFSLKDAMVEAKKFYKKGTATITGKRGVFPNKRKKNRTARRRRKPSRRR